MASFKTTQLVLDLVALTRNLRAFHRLRYADVYVPQQAQHGDAIWRDYFERIRRDAPG